MTSRVRSLLVAFAMLVVGACATLPDDAPVAEHLDTETGLTITRFGHAFELYRETFVKDPSGRFAFIGPFETNQMGTRELFLWIAVPFEPPPSAETPVIEVNGQPLALGTPGRAADFAGLRGSPYKIPTPWSSMYYFKIDAALVAQLGEAQKVTIRAVEGTKDGSIKTTFAAAVNEDSRFREFASRP